MQKSVVLFGILFFIIFYSSCDENKSNSEKKKLARSNEVMGYGCADFLLYKSMEDTMSVVCRGNDSCFVVDSIYHFTNNLPDSIFKVSIDVMKRGEIYNSYCSDLLFVNAAKPRVFECFKSAIKLQKSVNGNSKNITVIIEDAIFVDRNDTIKIDEIIFQNVDISNTPG